MPDARDYLTTELDKHKARAEAITDGAAKEARVMTDDEVAEVEAHVSKAKEIRAQIKAMNDNEALTKSIRDIGSDLTSEPEKADDAVSARTLGQAVVRSEAYRALKARGTSGKFSVGPIEVNPRMLAVAGTVSEDAGSNSDLFLPQRIPGIQGPAEAPLRIADLFAQGTAESNSLILLRETVSVNAADVVAERGAKPPSDIQFEGEPVTLEKIATMIKVSTEMLEDETAMASYLDSRLGIFVRQKEETNLVADLLAQAGQTADETDVDGENIFDAIVAGIAKVEDVGGLVADTVVMSVMDWARMSVLKAQGSGIYFSGGPYAGPDQNPWGVRLVRSGRIGDGNAVVGAFREGGTVWRKGGGVSVDATNSNEDDFRHNLTAIRAEERMKLFINRPDAFCKVAIAS